MSTTPRPLSALRLAAFAVALAGVAVSSTVIAEELFVQGPNLDIHAGKGPIYPMVAHVTRGAPLTVIAREGAWVKVQVVTADTHQTVQGYVSQNALTTQGGGNSAAALSEYKKSAIASNISTGNATKGLNEGAERYAQSKNLSSKPMNDLVAYKKSLALKADDFARFKADGNVGMR